MDLVDRIQAAFPRIWHAAHRHAGRSSTLSERDQRLLSHLGGASTSTRDLATHLAIAPSTLSEHLGQLEERGLVERSRPDADRRLVDVRLTEAGRAARSQDGPLDPILLQQALASLDPAEAECAVAGLELLARALGEQR